jgi:competence protein ComEC
MIRLALIFVFGVWVLQQQAILPPLHWAAIGIPFAVLAGFAWRRHRAVAHLSLILLSFVLGYFWAASMAQSRLANALPNAWERQDIEVIGVVASLPQAHDRGQRFEFDVEQVLTKGAKVPSHISLSHYGAGYAKPDGIAPAASSSSVSFRAGERWQLTVRLKRPHGTANPHTFDFEAWAFERDIRATGYIRQPAESRKLDELVYRPGYLVERVREHIRRHLDRVLDDQPYAGILRALAIGDDDAIDPTQWQVFLNTGTNHLISISGLHITMLSGLVFAVAMLAWRRSERLVLWMPARKAATVAAVVTALLYALVAGYSVPTQRTLYMLAIFALALWSNRDVSIARVLTLALLVVTLFDPWAVMAPGFWLSFGAVAVIAYALGGRLRRPHWLREAVNTQWAVTLGLIPLLLFMFQQVSLVSPLANALAIPVISLLVVPLTLLGGLLPIEWPLHLAHWVMTGCMTVLEWLAAWPASTWHQQAPSWWAAAIGMLGVLWLLLPKGFPMRWLGWLALLPLFLPASVSIKPGEMQVAVIDVGQGLAVLVRTTGHSLLYDAGSRYSARSDSGSRTIFPYLRGEGVGRLDVLVISHDDNDHSGGAASLLASLPIGRLSSSLPSTSRLLAGKPHTPCRAGQSWHWDGIRFEMLSPETAASDGERDNNRSCVLKIMSAHGSVLLPGDIEREAEARLVNDASPQLAADVLIVPHHGSKTSSTPAFIEAVHPQVAIFTVGYLNRFGHPKRAVMERYGEIGAKLYRSDRDGAVLMRFANGGIAIETWRQLRRRYWQDMPADCAECLAEKGLAR